jgi:hypothetical protein
VVRFCVCLCVWWRAGGGGGVSSSLHWHAVEAELVHLWVEEPAHFVPQAGQLGDPGGGG